MGLDINEFKRKIFQISQADEFEDLSLQLFYHQAKENPIYSRYIQLLGRDVTEIKSLGEIPFLPIELFKSKKIATGNLTPEVEFTSSGTSGNQTSSHFVPDLEIYRSSFLSGFNQFYGNIEEYCILALLPSYLERTGSSLIFMVDELIRKSNRSESGFYLFDLDELQLKLVQLKKSGTKTLLIGVSFALLDFAEKYPGDYSEVIFMETGGMKGRREELTRHELHASLKHSFNVSSIHSEYGMTELLSQAYSSGDGVFHCPAWMKILIRETDDPLAKSKPNKSGGIDVIDLANIYSCAFISTQDLGKTTDSGGFEVLGRFDQSDIRGCNLLINE